MFPDYLSLSLLFFHPFLFVCLTFLVVWQIEIKSYFLGGFEWDCCKIGLDSFERWPKWLVDWFEADCLFVGGFGFVFFPSLGEAAISVMLFTT